MRAYTRQYTPYDIRSWSELHNMTRVELAAALGVSASLLTKWVSVGKVPPYIILALRAIELEGA